MKKYKTSEKQTGETIEVREEFVPYGMKQLDSKDRISLGGRLKKTLTGRMAVEGFRVFLGDNGDILLRPTVSIPAGEAWIYRNPGVIGSIRQGLKDAAEGRTERIDDIEAFLRKSKKK